MIPAFRPDGNLPPGIHWATWRELCDRFGATWWRRRLLAGLQAALQNLRGAGCLTVYVDGSFVSSKSEPGDFDACWELAGVDLERVDPVLLTFDDRRAAQKAKYGGELFPVSAGASGENHAFLDFFQTDKDTGDRKGIVVLDLM